jgi:hypothetical protein
VPQVLAARSSSRAIRPALGDADHALLARSAPAIVTRSCLYAHAGDFESARVSYEADALRRRHAHSAGHEGIAFADFLAVISTTVPTRWTRPSATR